MISLTVAPIAATIAKDTDLVGKMDPYVTIEVAGKTERTKTVEAGGKTPRWAERFTFPCNQNDTITLRIYDDDVGPDDFIGELRLSVLEVLAQGGFINQTYPFASKNNSGTLTVQVSAQQSGVANLSTGAPIATGYVAPMGGSIGSAVPMAMGGAAMGMGAYGATTAYSNLGGNASYVNQTSFVPNNGPAGSNFVDPTKSVTGQYVNGLAPFNSTVYTPNPYLTHPQDHKPTCGCC